MITTDNAAGVARIALDRPAARNALTPDGLEALEAAVAGADERTDTRIIALRGAGDAFCAGADLDVVAELDREAAEELARLGQRVARRIERCETPVVAAIDGPAMGGGLELALACDVRVATPRSTFGEPGVTFGLFGAWGGTVRLPRIVGESAAADLALSGRTIDAETALGTGLVSRVVDDPADVVAELAANPPETLVALTSRLRDDADVETRERREVEVFGELVERHSDDLREMRG